MLAFAVAQRTAEIGLRRALGAQASQIANMVLGEAALLGLAGAVIGLVAAYAVNRGMGAFLVGVSPADVPTMAAGCAAALFIAVAGATAPALRAIRVDPARALRSE